MARARQQSRRVITIDPFAQVRRSVSTFSIHAVALDAAFAVEQPLATLRINGADRSPDGADGDNGNGKSRGPHRVSYFVILSPVVIKCVRNPSKL